MISFRKIEMREIPHVWNLANRIWNASYRGIISQAQIDYMLPLMYAPEVVQEELKRGVIWEYIVNDSLPVGFLSVYEEGDVLMLSKLYLDSLLQGKGLGQAALARAVVLAELLGKSEIRLNVNCANTKAMAAYERFGFRRVGERVFDIGGGFVMDDYIYAYTLNS